MSTSFISKIQKYYPATVKRYKTMGFVVEYFVFEPKTEKMVRFRVRLQRFLNHYQKIIDKKIAAQKVADDINKKLSVGWSPLYESDDSRLYTPIDVLRDKFIDAKEFVGCRATTMTNYRSMTNMLVEWLRSEGGSDLSSGTFRKVDAVRYMDFVASKKVSNRTYNNTLKAMRAFFQWSCDHCYSKENPFAGIKLLQKEHKKRELISHEYRSKILEYFNENKRQMSIVCKLVYYSAMRPNEIRNIKIKDINISKHYIYVDGSSAKNGKSRCATITKDLIEDLIPIINGKPQNYYLFGEGVEIMPGLKQVSNSYFGKCWVRMRTELKLPNTMQLYSLRDTGLSDFLHAGIDQLTVQHHADHSSIAIQNIYTDHYDENLNNTIFEKAPEF